MSIATEIQRLQSAKTDIESAITEMGVTVPQGSRYNDFPPLILAIESGGGVNIDDLDVYPVDFSTGTNIIVHIGTLDTANRVIRGGQVT